MFSILNHIVTIVIIVIYFLYRDYCDTNNFILWNVRNVMPSKPCKFGAVTSLCHCVITMQVLYLAVF